MVAYDPNYRERLWAARGGPDAAVRAMREILPYVDVILPSYPSDAVLLLSSGVSAAAVADGYGALCAEVALKCGARGAAVLAHGRYQEVPADTVAQVVDTTGAGDTWNGVYLMQRLAGAEAALAAAAANRAAGAKLAHRGAIPPKHDITQP